MALGQHSVKHSKKQIMSKHIYTSTLIPQTTQEHIPYLRSCKTKTSASLLDNFALGVQIGTFQVSKAVFQAKGAEKRNRC